MLVHALKKYDALLGRLVLCLAFLWPLLFLCRGIDEVDSGYYLANFKYFFDADLRPSIATELSFLFGGILYRLNPFPAFLGMRVFDWLINCASWVLVYRMLRAHMPKLWLAAGIFVGSLLVRRYPMIVSYNSFSFLFFIGGLHLMQQSLLRRNRRMIFYSGLLIGFNVFFRIPNALQALMVLIPFGYTLADRDFGFKNALRYALRFTAAGFLGLFLGIGLCVLLEGWEAFVHGIGVVLQIGQTGSHAPGNMFSKIEYQLTEAYYYFGALKPYVYAALVLPLGYALLSRGLKNKYLHLLLQGLCIMLCLYLGYALGNNLFMDMFVYVLAFLALLSTILALLLFAKHHKALYLHALMLLLFILSVPLGTDNGVYQFCLVGAPLVSAVLAYLSVFEGNAEKQGLLRRIGRSYARVFALLVVCSLMVGAMMNIVWKVSYRDGAYAQQDTRVHIPALRGMYTSAEKAAGLEAYYRLISDPALQGRELAVAGGFPLAHVLTDHHPILGYAWSDLKTADTVQMLRRLEQAERLPVVVLARFDRNLYGSPFYYQLEAFAESHSYRKTEHSLFTFYTPNE